MSTNVRLVSPTEMRFTLRRDDQHDRTADPDRQSRRIEDHVLFVHARHPGCDKHSFRWTHPEDEEANEGNSLLVTFELSASDGGTLLRMTETGFREMGWEVAVLEEQYQDHVDGWGHFLPRLVDYAATVEVAS